MAKKLPKEVNYLIDKVTTEDHESVRPGTRLHMGDLFLYFYDAKYKSVLDVWDQLPLIILLDIPHGKYILGINIHFIPWTYRIQFIKNIRTKGNRIKYRDIVKAWKKAKIPEAYAKLAIRKYLVSHIKSNIKIFTDEDDQLEIVKNILPKFKKKSMSQTYKDIENKIKQQRKKGK